MLFTTYHILPQITIGGDEKTAGRPGRQAGAFWNACSLRHSDDAGGVFAGAKSALLGCLSG